jgi:hypothetical protein
MVSQKILDECVKTFFTQFSRDGVIWKVLPIEFVLVGEAAKPMHNAGAVSYSF